MKTAAYGLVGLLVAALAFYTFGVVNVMTRRGDCVRAGVDTVAGCHQRIPLKW